MFRVAPLRAIAMMLVACAQPVAMGQGVQVDTRGYYRQPTLCGDTVVFVSEGDLWRVGVGGGQAARVTTHPGQEWSPRLSPDGQWVAFGGEYEGPGEVYVMPTAGGLPKRLTFEGSSRVGPRGWTRDGKVLYTTDRYATLPNTQMFVLDPTTGERKAVPLSQAADGEFADDGSLFFVRIPFNGSYTKRYKGGTIEQVWRWSGNEGEEAVNLTGDYPGTSRRPMVFGGRVYFASDRDQTMNLWSMTPGGKDLKQVTTFKGLDVLSPAIDASGKSGRVVFQNGADLYVTDLATGQSAMIGITLSSDLDQMREHWVARPMEYATAVHPSPDGDRVVITARGQVFVAPAKQGRIIEVARREGLEGSVRFRDARFSHDGKAIIALSDESGEVEVWRWPANGMGGVGAGEQLTKDADVLRWTAVPSPDGKHIAHTDKHHRLWMHDVEKKSDTLVEQNAIEQIDSMTWSPDGRWLAYAAPTDNMYLVVKLWSAESGKVTQVTTDRFQSYSPSFSPSGEWLFFLSDRHLETVVSSPWGINQPDPFLDKTTKIYAVALRPGLRWPYLPEDEVERAKKDAKKDEKKPEEKPAERPADKPGEKAAEPAADKKEEKKDVKKDDKKPVEIVLEGIQSRLFEVPVASGNYSNLFSTDKALFFLARDAGANDASLKSYSITNDAPEMKAVADAVDGAELTQDGKKIMIRKGEASYLVDAGAGKADLDKKAVDLSGWRLSVVPREEFRQMYTESWRLLRDYFYDPKMHGVDWKAMHAKYLPLVGRVRSRQELSDIMQQLTGELSALHHFVRDGDVREGPDKIGLSSLGCVLTRDQAAGGYVISKIYANDPDEPGRAAPVARPNVAANEGDVITAIDGVPTLSVADVNSLLRNKAGKQTLLTIRPAGKADSAPPPTRDAIAMPMTLVAESDLRYHEWEFTRRRMVEEMSGGQIGYLHLRAMGGNDWSDFVKGFYPVFHKQGLIIDVRHNRGGNIDSWVLSKLMRKAWMFWSQRTGQAPNWNMQYAFRGHMTMLVNERTASDGEAVAEGFKRLGLGKVIGTRTWGGEIWLSSSNVLVDKGIATAGEFGVWGPEGQWLIEGHGVEPDMVVDNMPHATFRGDDAQLKAAVMHLKKLIEEKPIPAHVRPEFPNKAEK